MSIIRWSAVVLVLVTARVADARVQPHHGKHRASRRVSTVRHPHGAHPLTPAERAGARGQSIGAPWAGQLVDATQLDDGDGYHIRRPWRSFGTQATVELVQHVLDDNHEWFPHVLAIGDLSAAHGGQITEHHSHQSGRDADIGLFYVEKPASYPASFVRATDDNLDCRATWKLLSAFAATANADGGAQVIFLDYGVQGILYRWAIENGVGEHRLARLLQYPRGRQFTDSLVRHFPNHDNHMHVRFKCPASDGACR